MGWFTHDIGRTAVDGLFLMYGVYALVLIGRKLLGKPLFPYEAGPEDHP